MTARPRLSAIFLAVLCTQLASAQAVPNSPATDPLTEPRRLAVSGQLKEAESNLRSYLTNHPASADAHFYLGYVLFREHKPTESLAEFTEGAKTRRPNPAELQTVASDYVMLEDYEDADKWFTAISKETPNDATIWYLLGRTKYNEGRIEEAASCFSRALSLRQKYVEAENNLGLAMHELNKPEDAKAAYQHAIEWQGTAPYDAQPFLNLGSLLVEGGDYDAAVASLKQAAALSPENPSIHEQLGAAYDALNRAPEAQTELERAVALAPDISGLHFKLAGIYKKLGMKDRARQELELCAKLNSTHSSRKTPNPAIPK
jgi:Flp pilus assembly protein TadD